MVRIRRELADTFPGVSFLPPTMLDSRCAAGVQWEGRTVLPEAPDFMGAYHRLWRKAVNRPL